MTPPARQVIPSTVAAVVAQLEGTEVEELELSWDDIRIRVRQDPTLMPVVSDPAPSEEDATVAVRAPLNGIYYSRPAPEQPSFVSEGALVVAGQTVGLIETMKLFNEVQSEVGGTVVSIRVQDGDLVEKDQELMRIEPGEPQGEVSDE